MATVATTPHRTERGQAVIEMALTLPLLLIVVFGIIDFGFMFQRYESVTNAAREGARLGILPGYTNVEAQNRALAYMAASGLSNGPVRPGCTGAFLRNSRCALMTTGPVTVAGSTPARTVNQVTVVVEYDHEYSFLGPLLRLFGPSFGTIRLRAASSMRQE